MSPLRKGGNALATRTISTKLAIDGESQYREALKRINSEMKLMQSNLKLVESQFAENSGSMEALRARGTALAEMHKTQSDKVKELKAALDNAKAAQEGYAAKSQELTSKIAANKAKMEELKNSAGNTAAEEAKLAEETKRLEQELETNNRYLDAAERGVVRWQLSLNSAQADLNKLDAEISRNNSAMESAGRSADNVGDRMQHLGDDVSRSAQSISELDGVLASAGTVLLLHKIADAFESCVEQSIAFESSMAGVKRTVGGSDDFIGELGESFKDLSTTIPITAEELASVATTAGQLGIAQENVQSFTHVMAQLATTTDLTADNAATMLAQFSNITGVSDYERLGAVVAELGDATATTASKVVEMSQGMAAAANVAGLSATDTLAISAAVGSLGIEAQAGSTAMQTLISTLYKATETGGEKLRAFAAVAGMSADEFKARWQTDAVGALNAFIQGLNDTERNGKSAIVILDELGITNVRQTKAILGLASAGDLLSNTVSQANRAWEENTALSEKAGIMYGTTEAKVTMLKNAFSNVKDAVGNQLTPAFGRLSDKLVPLMTKFASFVETNKTLVPLVLGVSTTLGTLVVTIGGFAAAIKIATVAQAAFNLVMDANPILLVVSALAALTAGLIAFFSTVDDNVPSVDELAEKTRGCAEAFDQANQTFQDSSAHIEATALVGEKLVDRLDELEKKTVLTDAEQREYNATIAQLKQLFPELDIVIDENTGHIQNGTQAIRDQIEAWRENAIQQALLTKFQDEAAAYADVLVELEENEIKLANAKAEGAALQEKCNTLAKEYADIEQQMRDIPKDNDGNPLEEYVIQYQNLKDRAMEIDAEWATVGEKLEANKTLQENLNKAISEGKDAAEKYKEEFEVASEAMEKVYDSMLTGTEEASESGEQAGANFVGGIASGVLGAVSDATDAGEDVGDALADGARGALDEHSPSKVGEDIGKNFDVGVANGAKKNAKLISEAMKSGFDGIKKLVRQSGEESAEGFASGFNRITSETQRTLMSLRSSISNATSGLSSEMYSVGVYAIDGMINGLQNRSGRLYSAIRKIVLRSLREAQDAAEVHSPSKKTEWIYTNVIEGGIVAIEKNKDRLYRAMQDATNMSMAVKMDTRNLDSLAESVESGLTPPEAQPTSYTPPDISGIEKRIDDLTGTMRETVDAVRAMRVVLDSGEMVGAISDKMDAELGQSADDFNRLEM